MRLKKFLLFGLIAATLPAVAEEAADRKTATSLKYVEHELSTRQNKFDAEQNKAMEYTNSAGTVQKRAVKSDLGTSTTDTSLPMVGGVNTKLNQKQDDIDPFNDHTAVTYTGTAGGIGRKGIYQTTGTYAEQSNNLIDAKTFNAALKNGLDSEFRCSDNRDPVSGLCWLYTIHNTYEESAQPYVSATGTVVQDGTPTPTNPIEPIFYRQGDMVLRKVGDYADSYDATTHKITRRVGVKVLNGTESWGMGSVNYIKSDACDAYIVLGNSVDSTGIGNQLNFARFPIWLSVGHPNSFTFNVQGTNIIQLHINIANNVLGVSDYTQETPASAVQKIKAYLAAQYAAGTPVTVYYPLETPVEEDWTETTYGENVYIPQNQ